MKNYNMILTKKLQKVSALLSGKTDEYKYLTGEEILPPGTKRVIEPANFIYPPLGRAFEKQIKTIEDQ